MTNTAARSHIAAAELARISAELEDAQADLSLLERLKSAQDRVNRLTSELTKAAKERDRALAAEAKANDASRFADISNMRVTEHPQTLADNVLRSSWTIYWTKPTWDGRATQPMEHHRNSFGALPPNVLDYLMERFPERIPAKILALAPDNPRDAFRRYFTGLKRGCLVG